MLNNEPMLLMEVFLSKADDEEQQRNLLLPYALAKIIAGCEQLLLKTQQVAQAAAILLCVEEAQFIQLLEKCRYVPSYQSAILELLLLADHY